MSEVPPPVDPDDPRARPLVEPPLVEPPLVEPPLVDPPLVVPPVVPGDVRYVREERVIADGPVPLAGDVDVNAVHEEERVRVLADGTVLREVDRVEQRSRFRDWLPWLLLAVVGLVLAVGLLVWYLNRSSSKPVPAVVGLRLDAALSRLQQDGFKVQVTRQSNARPAGVVFGQNPAASTKLDDGSTVRLLVSRGRARAKVPNGVGVAQATARDRLVQAGFRVMTAEVFSDQPRGTVVAQEPPAGGLAAPGTLVRLNISKGSATVNVPSEVGNPIAQARSDLAAKGLVPSVMRVPSSQPIDTVVAQAPAGGQVRKGSTVQLNVSKGAPAATTTTITTTATATTTTATTQTTTTATTATVTVPTTQTTTVTTPSTSTTATSTTGP
jgi:beta-lactam-binding protein with PASTA domain